MPTNTILMLYRILCLACLCMLSSCIDNKDYNLESLTITPTEAIPLASGELSILNIASDKDSSYIKTYPDGLLYFSYTKTLDSREIRGLFDLPANNSYPQVFDLPAGTQPPLAVDTQVGITVDKEIDFNFDPGQLSEMMMKGGFVKYNISLSQATTPALPFQIDVVMTDVVHKTTNQPLTFSATTGIGSVSMKDHLITMNDNKFSIRVALIFKKDQRGVYPR